MTDLNLPQPRVYRETTLVKALRTQRQVLFALMLHDIKSRFFGNGWGYAVTIVWPAVHIAIILVFFIFGRRPVPYGSSPLMYASIGILPYITWSYMSRFTMNGMMQNRSFLGYPIIKPLDMMAARLFLETISVFIITTGLIFVNYLSGVDIMPLSLSDAVFGLLSAILLGVGFGVLNSVICMIFPLWALGFVGIVILFYFTSGTIFNPEAMPAEIGYYVSWNPLMHCVEWIRKGYYADFPAHLLDKTYVISFGAGTLAVGLIMERLLKNYMKS